MFSIHINTLEEEFKRVCDTIRDIPFFIEKDNDGNKPEFLLKMKDIILDKNSYFKNGETKDLIKEFKIITILKY